MLTVCLVLLGRRLHSLPAAARQLPHRGVQVVRGGAQDGEGDWVVRGGLLVTALVKMMGTGGREE